MRSASRPLQKFDIESGETLDAVIDRINPRARIAVCGQISSYDGTTADWGAPRNLEKLAWPAR